MANVLDRRNVISVLKSYQDESVILKVTDYVYDENTGKVYVAAIYRNRSHTLELHNELLDQNDFPGTFGKRYFVIDGYLFLLDNSSDIAGVF